VARIALVAGPDPGHLFPIAGLAVALHRRGHQTLVLSGGPWLDDLRACGPHTAILPDLGPTPEDHDLAHIIWERAAQMAPRVRADLDDFAPEMIVTDVLTTVGHFVGDLMGLPVVSVCPHHLMDPDPDIPPVGLGRRPSRNPVRRFDDASIRRRQRASMADARRVRDQVRGRLALPPGHRPAARLLCTLPSLELRRRTWPEATWVVGALEWEPAWPRLAPPQGDAPLVVVTDSTASGVLGSLGEVAVAALSALPIRLVVTSSGPGRRDGNVVVGRGSHADLLDQAAVAVGPGGGGFIGKALSRGVPLAIVRGLGDQRESARRVAEAGAGLAVPPGPALGRRLRGAVERLLGDQSVHAAASRLKAEGQRLGPDHAARIVERHLPVGAGRR